MSDQKRNNGASRKVLNFMLDNAGNKLYLTQIAKKTGISDSTVHNALENKVEEGFVKKEKVGNLSYYWADLDNPLVQQKKILRTIKALTPLVDEMKEWCNKIILYGSAAQGKNNKDSDFDLFILSNSKDEVYKIFSNFEEKDKVELVVKNYPEWVEMKEDDPYFVNEIKRGTVLWEGQEVSKIA